MNEKNGYAQIIPDFKTDILLLPPPKQEATLNAGQSGTTIQANVLQRRSESARAIIRIFLCSFAALFYLTAISVGLLKIIDIGAEAIFTKEVFSGAIKLDNTPDYSSPPLNQGIVSPPAESITEDITDEAPGDILIHISRKDMSAVSIYESYNETLFQPDEDALLLRENGFAGQDDISAVYGEDAPLVLIIHTHATEAYSEEGIDSYSANKSFHSTVPDENVTSVGEIFASALNMCGINSIHCRDMFSLESYDKAYEYSAAAVYTYLEQYPSIKYVFDIHRDALFTLENGQIAPIYTTAGQETAQVMLVVGTNEAGAAHPDWENNLSLALNLQKTMLDRFPGSARPYNLRTASFNQQLSPGFLLLEIGSSGNTLPEAKRAAVSTALAFAEVINNEASPVTFTEATAALGIN